ncbi:unnamed protein product [Linum tenue]|uniref:Glycosyltransferase N-terminal domain-containing protein n=1 Tax=Linum tenue TaxID=586396 RepID=A0AAV0MS45_9ROSI|nr:unnamed protein product [Linum tenue]
MGCSTAETQQQKPHAVLLPFPAQGHVNPFMQLAKLLHSEGFHITFVNTEHNHRRLVRTRGPEAVKGLPDFQFEAIPDGLPQSDKDATQDPPALCYAAQNYCLQPFMELMEKLRSSTPQLPPVTCIVSDGIMTFGIEAAELLRVQHASFWTASACGLVGYLQFDELVARGIFPIKGEANLSDGTLDSPLDWIQGMSNIRLKDLPSFATSTDAEDVIFHFLRIEARSCLKSSAIIFNTFDEFEEQTLATIRKDYFPFPRHIYTIGPLHLLGHEMAAPRAESKTIGSNLWKEDPKCMEWLDQREQGSVVYVNYGSVTVMSDEHLREFAWGLAESKRPFLWIVRPDIAMGDSAILPSEFLEAIEGRGCLASWCIQQEVLSHSSVGVFLTHCGWNSTVESVSAGRKEVADVIEEMMSGETGKVVKHKAVEWKKQAKESVGVEGLSFSNFGRFVQGGILVCYIVPML